MFSGAISVRPSNASKSFQEMNFVLRVRECAQAGAIDTADRGDMENGFHIFPRDPMTLNL